MRILDKYILKRVAWSYLFILLTFIGLYFIVDIFTNLSDILKTTPSVGILLQYYFYSLPLIILRVSPLSLLISTLYTFGELNKNNEVISIRSSGLSIIRIAAPIVFFSLFVSATLFFLQEKSLMVSQKKVEDIKSKFIKENLSSAAEERNLAFTSGNMIFFAGKFLPKDKTLENVKIFKQDENRNIVQQILCKSIIYEYGFWIGKNVVIYDLNRDGTITGIPSNWETKKIELQEKPNELIFKKSMFSQFSSLETLGKEIESLRKINTKESLASLIIDYNQKITEPFSHLFLVIGILPIALEIKKRKVALSSLGVGFIFGFIYYAISSFSVALGKSGLILPFFSAWLGPLFFLTVGITGLLLIR
ncbi:MAG: LptF/LptG family permease [Candidatus Omnitrophota bacterium]